MCLRFTAVSASARHASWRRRVRLALFAGLALAALTVTKGARAATADTGATTRRDDHKKPKPPPTERSTPDEHNNGLLGPIRLGAFASVGFPRPISIEGMIKFDDLIGVGVEYGALPSLSISGVNANLNATAVDLRVFPLRNGFFVGLAVGHQHMDVSSSVTVQGAGTFSGEVTADTWFINPRIGFLYTLKWGLTIGIDAGVQIPVATSSTDTVPAEITASQTAVNVTQTFGKDVLPTINLLRLGFLF